jgi:hypothetical protein
VTDGFKELEDEIVHFKHVRVADKEYNTVAPIIQEFLNSDDSQAVQDELLKLANKLAAGAISSQDYLERVAELSSSLPKKTSAKINDLRLYKVTNHLYTPIILSDLEKIEYIKHIINVKSEVAFIDKLVEVEGTGLLNGVEWMFSKIDQTIDDPRIAMPYFSSKYNDYKNFYPDFIFWKKTDKRYDIYLVDPKGTEYSSYLQKADGFAKLFENNGSPKKYTHNNYEIYVHLKLVYDSPEASLPMLYKKYWISNDDFNWLKE